MKSKIFKISIATILIMVMTMTNFVFIGESLISYAIDGISITTATNNKNVEFAAYFKDDSGRITDTTQKSISSGDTKLYIQVEVKNEGYFNGSISLENSNFNLISSGESEYVNKIENNVITLNQIGAGNSAIIEVFVKEKREENFDLSLLNMNSELTLRGIYKDSSEKDRKIEAKRNVSLKITNNEEQKENIVNNLQVLTNKVLKVNGEDKRVVQLSLNLGMNDNNFPMEKIFAQVDVPDINGKQPQIEKIVNMNSMTEYNYDYSNKKVTFTMTNKANNNKVVWKNTGSEEILITFLYDADAQIDNINISSDSKITLYNNKELTANSAKVILKSNEEKEAIVTGKIYNSENTIYKGKLYNNIDRGFVTDSTINVNIANVADYLKIQETDLLYSESDGQLNNTIKGHSVNTVITQTTINKQELFNVIGEDGTATITNLKGEVLEIINKDTQSDENGNIVLKYNEEQSGIVINTTKAIATGKIHISNNKVIKQNDIQSIKNSLEFKTFIQATNNVNATEPAGSDIVGISKMELKESVTEARVEVSRNDLSTITENKNVDITAILKSNSEQYDLYKNPNLEIEFPEDVKDINVNRINKLYGDEFEISASKFVRNSKIVIAISLKGEQTQYKDSGIEGTTIVINADLKLNNKATSKTDSFKMTYTNEKANSYKDGKAQGEEIKEISIVSPKGLITTNNVEELDIQTIGEESVVNKTLEKGKEAQNITVKSEIINNNDNQIKDVHILGNFGTDGTVEVNKEKKENNLGLTLKSGINVEGIDTSKVKVYYSENEAATADLNEQSNNWKDTITDAAKTKKYLITVSNMEKSEGMAVSYSAEIPEQLQYNKQEYAGYNVTYTNSQTQTPGQVDSTTIGLETGKGPVAEAKLVASVGGKALNNNDEVKQGEIIKYSVEVRNTGSEDIVNGSVVAKVPEATELLEKTIEESETGGTKTESYKVVEKAEATINIDLLKAGETTTKTYELRVKRDATIGTTFEGLANVTYGEASCTTNTITTKIARGELRITLFSQIDSQSIVGEDFSVGATIENLTGNEVKDINIEWNVSDKYKFVGQEYEIIDPTKEIDENDYEEAIIKNSEQKTMNIDNIPANRVVYVYGHLVPNDIKEKSVKENITVQVTKGNTKYTSNLLETTILGKNDYQISLSANNENGYVKTGEEIDYTIQITNNNELDGNGVYLEDVIPSSLSIKEVSVDGQQEEINEENTLEINMDIPKGKTKTVNVKTVVDYNEENQDDEKVINKARLTIDENNEIESNEITHTLQQEEFAPNGTRIYKISGLAWLDKNSDGEKQDSDEILSGTTVKLFDTKTNKIAKDYNNEDITTTTNESGFYTLSKIPEGNYVVIFEYDTTQYIVTEYQKQGIEESKNSNVISKSMNIDGQEKIYAITDNINIKDSNVSNINMGLIKAQGFDLSLGKYVSKIIVQNSSGTSTYEYNDETLAKVELDSKKINNSNVIIEYSIKVSNVGELEGYVKNIVDYVPNDLKFSSELNTDWYQTGNNLYCKALANEKIRPGETRAVKLILTKTMTETNTGRTNNIAEIAESYNDAGIPDINSVAGNKAQGENDMGMADVIISVKTGEVAMYITLVISMLVILGVGIYFIEKKIINKHI